MNSIEHALGRLAGGGEEFHAGVVGLIFLRAHIGEQRALDRRLRRHDRRGADIAGAAAAVRAPATTAPTPSSMATIEAVCAVRELLAQARQMAAGHVAGLVREHADDLVRRLGVEQARRH